MYEFFIELEKLCQHYNVTMGSKQIPIIVTDKCHSIDSFYVERNVDFENPGKYKPTLRMRRDITLKDSLVRG